MADKQVEPQKLDPVKTAPDPDEDDLDDLDDVLDEFAATKLDSKAPAPSASGTGRPTQPPPAPVAVDEDAFQQELQKEMENLLGGFDNNPEMQQQFEGLLKELGEAAMTAGESSTGAQTAAAASTESSNGPPKPKAGDSFQEQIRKTMERMQESGDQASAAAGEQSDLFNEDMMSKLLMEMSKEGGGGEEGFAKMLTDMMEELTNKDILYEPMRELNEKFPDWMEKNKDNVEKDDLKRYEEQQKLVREIVQKFEEKSYSDTNTKDREYIVERMQKMQSVGSPPPDLVGDTNSAAEALGGLPGLGDEGCAQQ